jgi:hypothetical protein
MKINLDFSCVQFIKGFEHHCDGKLFPVAYVLLNNIKEEVNERFDIYLKENKINVRPSSIKFNKNEECETFDIPLGFPTIDIETSGRCINKSLINMMLSDPVGYYKHFDDEHKKVFKTSLIDDLLSRVDEWLFKGDPLSNFKLRYVKFLRPADSPPSMIIWRKLNNLSTVFDCCIEQKTCFGYSTGFIFKIFLCKCVN